VLAGLFVLLASGVATWLLLPLVTAPPVSAPLPEASYIVPIGPLPILGITLHLNLLLIILFVAAGTPIAAIAMGLLVRWLGSKVPAEATLKAAASAPRASGSPGRIARLLHPVVQGLSSVRARLAAMSDRAGAALQRVPVARAVILWVLIVIGLAATVVMFIQVLPPGFTLF
jgi:hypothetical protein